ncbi:phage tail sheath C-terminal domain-containing protein [Kitasatospora sp. CM 4170]|uniref:Phage tail sheath family protein n=1 Tax=Kitasatospora aburaviensis TaxID=67265 RepID=A0ABW1EQR7_9ACTN|nr:phage tail sheath C-terminal domain-containing protein [Kitasatospora sp. CM 4170]WNM44456.1 phage tail sheath C-terminal domain-containing protein [Kitasatospora sp. CM 4170]
MPEQLAQPGVYIEEIPSGVHTITGVATSVTAFVGRTARGSVDRPVTITGFDGFVREFGGLWSGSLLGFAVRDFFLNGGGQAVIGRLYREPATPSKGYAALAFGTGDQQVSLRAASPGAWGNALRARVEVTGAPAGELFTLVVLDRGTNRSERHAGVSLYADHPRCVRTVLERESALVRWAVPPLTPPAPGGARVRPLPGPDPTAWQDAAGRAEAGAAEAEGPLKAAVADLAKASAARSAAEAEAARAKAEHTVAESAKRSATDAGTAAEAERARAEDGVKSAGKEVDDAKKLDQNVPANRQKLADAQAKLAQAQTAAAGAGQAADRAAAALAQRTTEAAAAADRETATAKAADDARAAAANAATAEQGARTDFATAKAAAADAADQLGGADGADLTDTEEVRRQCERLLDQVDLFNLLCIPPYRQNGADVEPVLYDQAAAYCKRRRAILLVDPPSGWSTVDRAVTGFRAEADELGGRGPNAAVYFPRLRRPNPFKSDAPEDFVPCGAVAGVLARVDGARGVWKAGAGLEAGLVGVPELSVRVSDGGNGLLNPLGVNCLRSFPVVGRVVWGARTLAGADVLASEWKYLPVRRLALFVEESLFRGTQWVVFEPNGEALWAEVRLNVGAFMQQLFRQGALQGRSPREAYFVKCDGETTTQADRDRGVVNIRVGFAPLKPAEFVVVQVQQLSEQLPA